MNNNTSNHMFNEKGDLRVEINDVFGKRFVKINSKHKFYKKTCYLLLGKM